MKYTIKAHPTEFMGTIYRSRLEARWAAFFPLAKIEYQYEPVDLHGWTPDFRLSWPCTHSECNFITMPDGSCGVDPARGRVHSILVEVKPYISISQFKGHKCMDHFYGEGIPADSSAAFGENPSVTYWEMCHGAGGGVCTIEDDVNWMSSRRDYIDINSLWAEAGNITRWYPRNEHQ